MSGAFFFGVEEVFEGRKMTDFEIFRRELLLGNRTS